jgi:hypothetical protein
LKESQPRCCNDDIDLIVIWLERSWFFRRNSKYVQKGE